MVSSTRTISRARDARAISVARTYAKQRDKPYKTEQSRIREKKKKLTLRTTFQETPPGFQFLPVGTPDLAERCKELSRIRGQPVNVVNGDPRNKNGKDESKVSHHILRIGYHFRSEIVDDACSDLGYIYVRGKFVKEADYAQQSILAQTMMNHGLRPAPGAGLAPQHESGEQVRAAVKELFPRIPDDDLEYILEHAWAEGSKRVGTQTELPLSRRVQLATIARIRHHYTDYDRLLRAFEWSEARLMVEPTCVQKLLEWRGENEQDHDDEIEEIVREVIVIDDDEDDDIVMTGNAARQSIVLSSDDSDSDASVKITYRPAMQEDLRAERHDERSIQFVDAHARQGQRRTQRDADVRHRIGQARLQMRNVQSDMPGARPTVVHVPDNQLGNDTVVIDGRVFRKAPEYPMPTASANPLAFRLVPIPQRRGAFGLSTAPQDQPIPSVEPGEPQNINGTQGEYGSNFQDRPPVPDDVYRHTKIDDNRRSDARFVDLTTRTPPTTHRQLGTSMVDHNSPSQHVQRGFVDLTTDSPSHYMPLNYVRPPHHVPSPARPTFMAAPPQYSQPSAVPTFTRLTAERPEMKTSASAAHGPKPFGLVDAQVAPIQYMPLQPRHRSSTDHHRYANGTGQPKVVYVRAAPASANQQAVSFVPQPLHGAPAPIQQMARGSVQPHHRSFPNQSFHAHSGSR